MASKSRNVFSRNRAPLRVTSLGGSATANDPFASLVANANKQLDYLNKQKALSALAAGDPDTFLAQYDAIKSTLKGDEVAYWDALARKASDKIDEMEWANRITEDPKQLEAFLAHLKTKLSAAQPGGSDAANIITSMDGVKKAIIARDQNASDQKALAQYIQDNNHESYARYLIDKLSRTTDATAWASIRQQIDTLKGRIATEEQVGRVQARSDVVTSYLESGKAAGKAIAELRELQKDPKISATEVSAIETLITQIHDREESKARQGAASAKATLGINVPEFQKNLSDYQQIRNKVDQILANGGLPSPEDLTHLNESANVLATQYQTAARVAAQYGETSTAESLTTKSNNIDDHLGTIPGLTDKNILKRAVGDDAAAFNTVVTSNTDPLGRLNSRINRITALSNVSPQLQTPNAINAVRAEINKLAADELKDTSVLANKDDLTPAQRDSLRTIMEKYQSWGGTLDAAALMDAAKQVANETDALAKARKFAQITGLKLKPLFEIMGNNIGENDQFFGQTGDNKASAAIDELVKLANASTLGTNRDLASEIGKRLVGTPGAIPFGPIGSPEYQMLGLTSMDILEMRRGAGLIKSSRPPVTASGTPEDDLTAYETSGDELRQGLKREREDMQMAAVESQPSIEDTLLQFIPPPPMPVPPSMFDMGGEMAFGSMGGDSLTSGNAWEDYLNKPVEIDIPSFSIPTLPDPAPFTGFNFDTNFGLTAGFTDDNNFGVDAGGGNILTA